jgi:DNA-binding Lrp family transcriptional regulator
MVVMITTATLPAQARPVLPRERSADRPHQRLGRRRREGPDEEGRPLHDEHAGDGERRHARVEHEAVAVAERLDDDERGERRHGDEVDRAAGVPAELPAAGEHRPNFVRVAVADLEAYEAFYMGKLAELPGLARVNSQFTMKTVKAGAAVPV